MPGKFRKCNNPHLPANLETVSPDDEATKIRFVGVNLVSFALPSIAVASGHCDYYEPT